MSMPVNFSKMLVSHLKGNDSKRVSPVRDEGRVLRISVATFDDWPGVVPEVVTQAIVRWFRSGDVLHLVLVFFFGTPVVNLLLRAF